ncbi:MAG: MarR family transcriptional regulator [Saprospiraceae bacterium]|nr:MarR family transcriptional regulator [Saprospiraceae bacterium]
MRLEDEIKSTRALPPRQRATLNILFTASWISAFQGRYLRQFGLTGPQYNILRILRGSHPKALTVLDIKCRMLDRSSNVSRLVEKLRASGLVDRCSHKDDRRMVLVNITEAGKKLLSDIDAKGFTRAEFQPGQSLTENEADLLAELLDKYREHP